MFGQRINLGHHEIIVLGEDIEAPREAGEPTPPHPEGAGVPCTTARLRLAKPMLYVFEHLRPEPTSPSVAQVANRAVVLDSSGYRSYCLGGVQASAWTIDTIRICEARRQVAAFASPYTIMELASHLAGKQDPDHACCRRALNALFEHCSDGPSQQLRMVPDNGSLLAAAILGVSPLTHRWKGDVLASLTKAIYAVDGADLPAHLAAQCGEVKLDLAEREARLIEGLRHTALRLAPDCGEWRPFVENPAAQEKLLAAVRAPGATNALAAAFAETELPVTGRSVPTADEIHRCEFDFDRLKVGLSLLLRTLEFVAIAGGSLSNRQVSNILANLEILICIGQSLPDGSPTLTLITADRSIRRAAEQADAGDHVFGLDEYLAALTSVEPAADAPATAPSSS